jgi:hypothetical protein
MADVQPDQPRATRIEMNLQPTEEVGVFADFANVWNTPNTFVLDFLSVKEPPHPAMTPEGPDPDGATIVNARVAARVRIPSEQVGPLIQALQTQFNGWLAAQGRNDPPDNWLGSPGS